MKKISIAKIDDLKDRQPAYALVANVDLVIIKYDGQVSVLYGRCHHRGALLADGHVNGDNLVCGVHGWDYRYDSGISSYKNEERLPRFSSFIEDGLLLVDEDEISAWHDDNPQPYQRDQYLGTYQDIHGSPDERHNGQIQ